MEGSSKRILTRILCDDTVIWNREWKLYLEPPDRTPSLILHAVNEFMANRASAGLGGMIQVETIIPASRRWGNCMLFYQSELRGNGFWKWFLQFLMKVCVWLCAESGVSVKDKNGASPRGRQNGGEEDIKHIGCVPEMLLPKKKLRL